MTMFSMKRAVESKIVSGNTFCALALAGASLIACQQEGATQDSEGDDNNDTASALTADATAGSISFDSFSGASVDDKIRTLNAWAKSFGSSAARPAVVFDSKVYTHTVPIELWSGLSLVGGRRTASREYGTGTVLSYRGAANTSQLAFVTNSQGYPSDGSPRDISFDAIQFVGGSTTNHVPKNDPSGSGYAGKTLWYVNWHDCGFVGFNTIYWGWGDGVTMNGITHVQAVGDTAFYVSGAENHFFDGYSFIDNSSGAWASSGKPFFRTRMEKSSIGRIMFSARGNSYQLSIEGGRNLVIDGAAFDAPTSAPTLGKQISISGGSGIRITNASFKGGMASPGSASGGTSGNRALIHITGGTQIVIDGNNFLPSTPLAWVGPNVAANQVKWGLNGYPTIASPVIQQSRSGQIVNIDPTVAVQVSP